MDYEQAIDLIKARIEWYRGKGDEDAIKVLEVLLQDFATWEDIYQHQLRGKARNV